MHKAIWNGEIIAESKSTKVLDGNRYFPKKSLKRKFVKNSETYFISSDKGKAKFMNLVVDDKVNWNGAWYYTKPKKNVSDIKNFVAFGPGVTIEK